MNKISTLKAFGLILLTWVATGCSKESNHKSFLAEHGITETDKIPEKYEDGNGWKTLGGNYVYYMDIFNINSDPQMLYIVADKKEQKLLGLMHVNPHITVAAIARGVTPATVVTNYEEMNPQDIAKANDMTEFNALLRTMPEMKDFKWKDKLQNQIASGILLKTHFIFVTKKEVDDKLFSYSDKPEMQDHDQQLKEIFKSEHLMYNRDVQRLNTSVELGQYIALLGFSFDKNSPSGAAPARKFYINDLLKDDPINFEGKGKMFFFVPFKSFTRIKTKGETPSYFPAIQTFEYTHTPGPDGFPEFKRNTHFASLL